MPNERVLDIQFQPQLLPTQIEEEKEGEKENSSSSLHNTMKLPSNKLFLPPSSLSQSLPLPTHTNIFSSTTNGNIYPTSNLENKNSVPLGMGVLTTHRVLVLVLQESVSSTSSSSSSYSYSSLSTSPLEITNAHTHTSGWWFLFFTFPSSKLLFLSFLLTLVLSSFRLLL